MHYNWLSISFGLNYLKTQMNILNNIHIGKTNLDTNIYNRYAIFHKSEEGKSIDLSESKHATRL